MAKTKMRNNANNFDTNRPPILSEAEVQRISLEAENVTADILNSISSRGAELYSLEKTFRLGVDRIRQDPLLSEVGKQQKISALTEKINAELDGMQKEAYIALDTQIASLEAQRTLKKLPGNEVVNTQLEIELRGLLRNIDPLEAVIKYQSATKSGDDALLEQAIQNQPRAFPLITNEKVLEEGLESRLERQHPAASTKLTNLRRLKRAMVDLFRAARSELQTI